MKFLLFRQNMSYQIPTVSYGLGVVGTLLHEAGHEVQILDNNSFYKSYSDSQLIKIIKNFQPDVLGFNIVTANALVTYSFLKKIKKTFPKLLCLAGGIHMKYCYEEAIENGFDVVANREAEAFVVQLFEHLGSKGKTDFKQDLDAISGISFVKDDGSLFTSVDFPMVSNLDDIPFVNYELFNLRDYFRSGKEQGIFYLLGQRGCPFKCTFCSNEEQRRDKRLASAERLFNEMMHHYDKYGIKYVSIIDNNFLIVKRRVIEFCDMMIKTGMNKKVSIVFQTKLDTINDESLITLMKEAGFNKVAIGIERLDPYSLEMIKKPIISQNLDQIFTVLKKNKIDIHINFLLNFPFESIELLHRERSAFLKLKENVQGAHINILQPMPGTPYYDDYPKTRHWYLDPSLDETMRSYFGKALELNSVEILEKNYFNLDSKTIEEIRKIYIELKQLNHGNIVAVPSLFTTLAVSFDKILIKFSQILFLLSPRVEHYLFSRLSTLRYHLGMRLFGHQLLKNKSEEEKELGQNF
jgi:anaerobic magnesium-protoporphyrin IX monomethyl ester cyclase